MPTTTPTIILAMTNTSQLPEASLRAKALNTVTNKEQRITTINRRRVVPMST
jgi:hypothetical protein